MLLPSLTKSKEVLTRASNSLSVATNVVANEYEEARHNITRLRVEHFRLGEELKLQDALECNWCGLNNTKGTVQDILLCLR
jgi:peptide subunit release factor 1 (eRF1)